MSRLSLKDRIANDISRCFMRGDHFAETFYWNGYPITCVSDEEGALKRKNNNVNDIGWDNNISSILLYTPEKDFPGGIPEPNIHIMLNDVPMKILSVDVNLGMLGIYLTALEPREF